MMQQLPFPGFEFHDGRGYVYIGIRSQQIKIGYSLHDPLGRCKQLGLKPLLVVHGTLNDEKALHKKFRRSHIDREWFMFTPEVGAAIDAFNARETDEQRAAGVQERREWEQRVRRIAGN